MDPPCPFYDPALLALGSRAVVINPLLHDSSNTGPDSYPPTSSTTVFVSDSGSAPAVAVVPPSPTTPRALPPVHASPRQSRRVAPLPESATSSGPVLFPATLPPTTAAPAPSPSPAPAPVASPASSPLPVRAEPVVAAPVPAPAVDETPQVCVCGKPAEFDCSRCGLCVV